jgi:hypothetical protein
VSAAMITVTPWAVTLGQVAFGTLVFAVGIRA